MGSRYLSKMWRGSIIDGRLQTVRHTWTHRARWYVEINGQDFQGNIRLNLEDLEGSHNHYPRNREAAQAVWDQFKAGEINSRGQKQRQTDTEVGGPG